MSTNKGPIRVGFRDIIGCLYAQISKEIVGQSLQKKSKIETILGCNLILLIRLFSGCLGIRLQAIYFNMAIEFKNSTQTV